MAFTQVAFVLFVLAVVGLYNLLPTRRRAPWLLVASYLFYAQASLLHLLLLGVITVTTFAAARSVAMHRRQWIVVLSVVVVVLPLGLLKYSVFVVHLLSPISGITANQGDLFVLPLGISFFTFQAVAYIVDVYRGDTQAERLDRVALHLAFFPKLLAGPIERAQHLIPQLQTLARSTPANLYAGAKVVLWGFFCKLVVADRVASIVDPLLATPTEQSGATLLVAFTLYAFQIYFDFLGYTSIALGVARCFTVHLNPNFSRPYAATSLREFWRRWHISLSTWFRDYVYIPLGGNTTHGARRFGQLMLVFLISGLWHGAALNFLVWGGFHGLAYWIEEQLRRWVRWPSRPDHRALAVFRRLGLRMITFGVVTFGWVFFRLSDPSDIRSVLERVTFLSGDIPYGLLNPLFSRTDARWFLLVLCTAVVLDGTRAFREGLERVPASRRQLLGDLAYVNWFAVTLVLFGDLGVRDFTYFSF